MSKRVAQLPGMTSRWVADEADTAALTKALGATAGCRAIVTAQGADGTLVGTLCAAPLLVTDGAPRLCWRLNDDSPSLRVFARASHVALNFIGGDDEANQELARRFESSRNDKFAAIAFEFGLGGAPLLERALATFECENAGTQLPTGGNGHWMVFNGPVLRYRQAADPL